MFTKECVHPTNYQCWEDTHINCKTNNFLTGSQYQVSLVWRKLPVSMNISGSIMNKPPNHGQIVNEPVMQ